MIRFPGHLLATKGSLGADLLGQLVARETVWAHALCVSFVAADQTDGGVSPPELYQSMPAPSHPSRCRQYSTRMTTGTRYYSLDYGQAIFY